MLSIDSIQPLIGILAEHPYLYAFIALLFAGESILLPVIFIAVSGRLDMDKVVAIAVAATVISDSAWYWLGRAFPRNVYERFTGKGTEGVIAKLERVFEAKGPQILYLSKFVYGTRIAAQVLSGVHRMSFALYTVVNALGVVSLTAVLVALAYTVRGTVEGFGFVVHAVQLAFLAFVAVAVLAHLAIGKALKKKWFQ